MPVQRHPLGFDEQGRPDVEMLIADLEMAVGSLDTVIVTTEERPALRIWVKRRGAGPYYTARHAGAGRLVVYASARAIVAAVLPAYLASRRDRLDEDRNDGEAEAA